MGVLSDVAFAEQCNRAQAYTEAMLRLQEPERYAIRSGNIPGTVGYLKAFAELRARRKSAMELRTFRIAVYLHGLDHERHRSD